MQNTYVHQFMEGQLGISGFEHNDPGPHLELPLSEIQFINLCFTYVEI